MVKEIKNKMIKIEDSIESMTNAMKELHEALKKGGGIGFDFSGLERKVAADMASKLEKESINQAIQGERKAHWSTYYNLGGENND